MKPPRSIFLWILTIFLAWSLISPEPTHAFYTVRIDEPAASHSSHALLDPTQTTIPTPTKTPKPTSTPIPIPPPADPSATNMMIILGTLAVAVIIFGLWLNRRRAF